MNAAFVGCRSHSASIHLGRARLNIQIAIQGTTGKQTVIVIDAPKNMQVLFIERARFQTVMS